DAIKLPPPNISPQGPTNLQPALQSIASQLDGSAMTEIILISDADATIENPRALANELVKKKIRLSLLATADAANSSLANIVQLTGGQMVSQLDPHLWNDAAEQLLQATLPNHIEHSPIAVGFINDLSSLPSRAISQWNHTWLKPSAIALAESDKIALAARWRLGAGQVAATGFAPDASELAALTALIETPPRDPRFKVIWSAASRLSVSVDAIDAEKYLNDLDVKLELIDPSSRENLMIPQTGPGKYEISLPARRSSAIAIVRVGGQIVQRFAIPARYAPEFDAIGNDQAAMRNLAQRSDGEVIFPSQTTPIDFTKPIRKVSLVSLLAILGASFIAMGLIKWKNRV
ncbi:MAG TPA: hypothetical protein VKK61_04280, partial [Tepidisphaeraceae bacterium]|nr:hypothetical protein [Tepidisphaeraceae bacterium]